MREIEFRGKRIDNGEWVYGSLVVRNNDGFANYYIYNNHYDETEINEYADEDGKVSLESLFIKVIPESVGQYTGIKGKNDKKIYEGDIIKNIPSAVNFEPAEGKIYWHSGHVRFAMRTNGNEHYLDSLCIYEIIGNITDNPELLNS